MRRARAGTSPLPSLEDVQHYLRFAAVVGADVYLLHPGQIYDPANEARIAAPPEYPFVSSFYWRNPDRRRLMVSALESSIAELLELRESLGLSLPLALENLGFPNLGTTFREIERVQIALARRFGLRLVLDVPHLWTSRHTLLRHPELAPWLEGFPADQQSFYAELADFVGQHGDKIAYYHLYGATTLQEHLPVRADSSHRSDRLDLCLVGRIIGTAKPIITEVFHTSRQEKLRSVQELRSILASCA
jgi:sugar phosphate isomerase/epimerase